MFGRWSPIVPIPSISDPGTPIFLAIALFVLVRLASVVVARMIRTASEQAKGFDAAKVGPCNGLFLFAVCLLTHTYSVWWRLICYLQVVPLLELATFFTLALF